MSSEASLRRRIVRACTALAAVVCAVFALILLGGVHALEDQVLDERLVGSAGDLIRNHVQGARGPVHGDAEVYRDAQVPAPLRGLAPGLHELDLGERVVHVFILDQDGHRYAVVDDESAFERMEGILWMTLAGAAALCVVLAFLLGVATAKRVIRPLVALADAVKRNRPLDGLPALSRGDEVGLLARALAVQQQEAQRFLAREQLFTGDVSHELRTPLTVMLGAAEVLSSRLAASPELLPLAERIRRTAVQAGERVSALLLLSRAPEHLDSPLVDVVPLLQGEMERCSHLLHGKPVTLELRVEHRTQVRGRPELILIAFGNLVRNACQFTDEGHVRVVVQEQRILVEDSGSGIPEEISEQIFDRFVRVNEGAPGSALGLAIVRRVCEHLGWAVHLDRLPGGGSRFLVCFAAADELAPGANDDVPPDADQSGAGVLLLRRPNDV